MNEAKPSGRVVVLRFRKRESLQLQLERSYKMTTKGKRLKKNHLSGRLFGLRRGFVTLPEV